MNRFLLIVFLLLSACQIGSPGAGNTQSRTLTVFAAASLTDAFTEIGRAFETAHPGVSVTFNFAGSQALRTQIEEGAQVDVFASANATEMDALVAGGQVDADAPQLFVSNELVVIVPTDNPAGIHALEDLARPGIQLILAAEEVPVGNYSRQSLSLMNELYGEEFDQRVLANLVSNEDNVRQVVTKVQLGEADAGIVYTSDAVAAPGLVQIHIPAEQNIVAVYPIAALAAAPEAALAAMFVDAVLSEEGQAVLHVWGFLPPPD